MHQRPSLSTVVVVVVLLAAAAGLAFGAWAVHQRVERDLLDRQIGQARGVLTSSATSAQLPLAVAASDAARGGSDAFVAAMTPLVGPNRQFTSAALLLPDGSEPVVTMGSTPHLVGRGPGVVRALSARAASTPTMAVLGLLDTPTARLGLAMPDAPRGARAIAYGEVALPQDRTSYVNPDPAYDNVDYALYLGGERRRNLLYSSTPEIPIEGRRSSLAVPIGDDRMTLVFGSRATLGGWLSANLWWIIGVVGASLALCAGVVTAKLTSARVHADDLAAINAQRYEEQLRIAVTLQRSLLPSSMPRIPGVSVAARYEPATTHAEVGGDWYDVVEMGDRLVVMVGDVSGHGVAAATMMAAMRYAARAYVVESSDPGEMLQRLNHLVDAGRDGRFATVLCVALDRRRRELAVASAGHPAPLLIHGGDVATLAAPVGPPIGAVPAPGYEVAVFPAPERGRLLCFTDGLYERRGEGVDTGLDRLRRVVATADGPIDELVTNTVAGMLPPEHEDDVVLIAVEWQTADVAAEVSQ